MGLRRSRLVLPRDKYKDLCNRVMTRDKWRCRVCSSRSNLHCHHVVFRSQGGDDADYNLLTVCNGCHSGVHERHLVVMPVEEGGPLDCNGDLKFLFVNGWIPRRVA